MCAEALEDRWQQLSQRGYGYTDVVICVFVFKQKTADEIEYGLVGSEMGRRDSGGTGLVGNYMRPI